MGTTLVERPRSQALIKQVVELIRTDDSSPAEQAPEVTCCVLTRALFERVPTQGIKVGADPIE